MSNGTGMEDPAERPTTQADPGSETDADFQPETITEVEADYEAAPGPIARKLGTLAAFRHRDYSLFWSGALVSNIGTWMQMPVLGLLVYSFRRSEADLGIVNALSGLPVLFLAIPAGLLADRVDRRVLIMWAQVALMAQALALGVLFTTGNLTSARPLLSLGLVSALGVLGGLMAAITFPAWQSMVPDLVPRDVLLNGIALNAAGFQGARMLGPLAAAGVLLLSPGAFDTIFYINAVSFVFVIAALAAIRTKRTPRMDREVHARPREGTLKTLLAGLAYAREDKTIGLLILSVAMMTVFGMPYMMLLPAVVDKVLVPVALIGKVRRVAIDTGVNYLVAANGLGALVGALMVASFPKGIRREPLVRYTLLAMSVLLVAFTLSSTLPVMLVVSALTGAAFLTSTSLMNTSIQACVPHHLRGRVMALFVMAFMGLMPVSSLLFGLLGQAVGPMNAVLAGAAVLGAYSLFLVLRPQLLDRPPCEEGAGA